MQLSTILFATLLALPQSYAQQSADGVLVPFTSALPSCASQCGPLYDVQGGCATQACFCGDARLSAFRQSGTAGVSSVCGAAACTAAADLEKVKSWYTSFCGAAAPAATTTTAGTSASASATAGSGTNSGSNTGNSENNSGGGGNHSWLATHTRWVIMIVIIVVGLILLWVGAWYFRRRYLRNKEKEIEMSPPVAWGPNQVHGAAGGYQYGDGIVDGNRAAGGANGGHHKEMAPAQGKRLSKAKMGWFKASK